jgi:hypothetical protein
MPANSGAAKAAGVPNPAAPSTKLLNIHPIMIAWMRRSPDMLVKEWLITDMAPDCFNEFKSSIAPKIVTSTSKPFNAPNAEYAAVALKDIFQTRIARTAHDSQAIGITLFAGQLRTTIKKTTVTMGKKATKTFI